MAKGDSTVASAEKPNVATRKVKAAVGLKTPFKDACVPKKSA